MPMTADLKTIRVDTVGSLLRPESLKQAFARYDAGEIGWDDVQSVADTAIRDIVAEQEAHGLPLITDGEFRRRNWMQSFGAVSGFASGHLAPVRQSTVVNGSATQNTADAETMERRRDSAVARMAVVENWPAQEHTFAQQLTDRPVKGTAINPDRVVQSFDAANSTAVYRDADDFCADAVRIGRELLDGLVQAGCRYVQVDAPGYMMYADEASLATMRRRGEDPEHNLQRAIDAENRLIEGYEGVVFGLHICRGNRRSQWHLEGTYDQLAERMFAALNYDRLLLEYDSDRAGGFEPLRLVPRGKVVVLGLISTKVGELETRDELLRRIDDAARYLDIDQLAISPQCGFASVVEGNLLTTDQQWAKLDLMRQIADEVWGQ